MRIVLILSLTLFVLMSLSGFVSCQDDDYDIKTIDGRIQSVDVENSQIVMKSTETLSFSVPSSAKIINSDGFDMQLSDINIGNYVTIDYYTNNSGKNIITNMEVAYNQ